jgi:N utilization substance protein B
MGRECAVQFLYGLDFTEYDWESAILDFWATTTVRQSAKTYAERLVQGVMQHREALDEEIVGALSLSHWRPDRVGRVERNILRVALYELRHGDDVPQRVAINEAIEIAKRFGNDEAPRFINGVLDRLKGE